MVIFMTLSLTVLFSLLGLSADLGYSYYVQLQAQAAADASARGAAIYAKNNGYICSTYVSCNSSYSCPTSLASAGNALQAGCLYAQSNGFTNTGNQTVTMIANNTTLGDGAAPALWIQANVSQTVSHMFLFLAGFSSGPVAAQAIAGISASPNASCVYVLDNGNTSGALNISGTAKLTGSGCGVWVNSSSSSAISLTGSGNISAPQIEDHGNASIGGGVSPVPTITTGAAVVADPFLSVAAPTVSSTCGKSNQSYSTNTTIDPSIDAPSGGTNVGVYCGGITVGGSAQVTMNPGVYIINGGGFNIGNSGKITGTGVTVFLTGQHGQTNAPMNLSGSSITSLTAPTGGPYQGILFYQDRSATYASANQIQGSASIAGSTGAFYFPGTSMTLSGAISAATIAFVVKDLTISGSATLNNDRTGTVTGLAARTTALLQ
jgi:hypothetical protein